MKGLDRIYQDAGDLVRALPEDLQRSRMEVPECKAVADLALNQVRVGIANIPGAQIPWPYGGRLRAVVVDPRGAGEPRSMPSVLRSSSMSGQ